MAKIKKPSIADQQKIDEVVDLMTKHNISLLSTRNPDVDFVIRIGDDKFYAVTRTTCFPPRFDDSDFIKSDENGIIYEYNENGELIE